MNFEKESNVPTITILTPEGVTISTAILEAITSDTGLMVRQRVVKKNPPSSKNRRIQMWKFLRLLEAKETLELILGDNERPTLVKRIEDEVLIAVPTTYSHLWGHEYCIGKITVAELRARARGSLSKAIFPFLYLMATSIEYSQASGVMSKKLKEELGWKGELEL